MSRENTSHSIEDYVRYWKNKIEKNKKDLREYKKKLIKSAEECAKLLKEEFDVKKVYLIGSLAQDWGIHKRSDIDLAVIGLQDNQYFNALNRLYEIVPKGVDIDLITIETASNSFKKAIKQRGLLI